MHIPPYCGNKLALLEQGDGRDFYPLLNSFIYGVLPEPYTQNVFNRSMQRLGGTGEAQYPVLCGDSPRLNVTVEEYADYFRDMGKNNSTGEPVALIVGGCRDWPFRATERYTGPWSVDKGLNKTRFPILLVSTDADPVTPLPSALKMNRAFGSESSTLLIQHGYSHPSLCTVKNVHDYFVNGIVPKNGTHCTSEPGYIYPTNSTRSKRSALSKRDAKLLEAVERLGLRHSESSDLQVEPSNREKYEYNKSKGKRAYDQDRQTDGGGGRRGGTLNQGITKAKPRSELGGEPNRTVCPYKRCGRVGLAGKKGKCVRENSPASTLCLSYVVRKRRNMGRKRRTEVLQTVRKHHTHRVVQVYASAWSAQYKFCVLHRLRRKTPDTQYVTYGSSLFPNNEHREDPDSHACIGLSDVEYLLEHLVRIAIWEVPERSSHLHGGSSKHKDSQRNSQCVLLVYVCGLGGGLTPGQRLAATAQILSHHNRATEFYLIPFLARCYTGRIDGPLHVQTSYSLPPWDTQVRSAPPVSVTWLSFSARYSRHVVRNHDLRSRLVSAPIRSYSLLFTRVRLQFSRLCSSRLVLAAYTPRLFELVDSCPASSHSRWSTLTVHPPRDRCAFQWSKRTGPSISCSCMRGCVRPRIDCYFYRPCAYCLEINCMRCIEFADLQTTRLCWAETHYNHTV
ncbi:TAP-like domain-containing protein [Rhizoctonia solani AG-1 IA]|uniref:TAP-like domain-containing protein n=1 Tax=Thanatephorus cucumeris (strain AG1-IA) TaxID=983506 RepID=L8WPM0_THACA|nr:TAP-like domain-containing protein [Rhizoctonia solani AG-1 IA]